MRLNLWLAQPETERRLAAALRIAVIAFTCWGMAAAYGLWSTRSALAASQSAVMSRSKKISEVAQELPRKRVEAGNAVSVKVAASESAASADLTDELSRIAQVAGADVAGVRIGDGGQGKGVAGGTDAATPGPSSSASAPAGDGGNQEIFECNITGDYGALERFLDELAASRHILAVTAVEVTQTGTKTRAAAPQLEMKMNGTVYVSPEKP